MSGYLLDINVVSELRNGRRTDPNVAAWFATAGKNDLFLSVLVIGEIRKGIEQARKKDPARADALERWLAGLEDRYADRILPVTAAAAQKWGRLSSLHPIPTVDALLAATALAHDLTLVTRNVNEVAHTGVKLLDPFTISQAQRPP